MVSLKKSEHSISEHYFSKSQTSELKITEFKAHIRGFDITLKLGSGTFSAKK